VSLSPPPQDTRISLSVPARSCGKRVDRAEAAAMAATSLVALSIRFIGGNTRFPSSVSSKCGYLRKRRPPSSCSSALIPLVK
jgi:hypothetical protein